MEGPLKALARSVLNIWSEFDWNWFKTSVSKRGYAHGTNEEKIGRKEKKVTNGRTVSSYTTEYSLELNGKMMSNQTAQLSRSQHSSLTISTIWIHFKIFSVSLTYSRSLFFSPSYRKRIITASRSSPDIKPIPMLLVSDEIYRDDAT